MKPSLKIILLSVLSVALVAIAPALVFSLVAVPYPAGIALAAFGISSLVVAATVNAVKTNRLAKKLLDTPLSFWQTHFMKRREEIHRSVAEETAKLNRLLRRAFCYNLFLAFACVCISSGIVILLRAFLPFNDDFPLSALPAVTCVGCVYLCIFYLPVITTLFAKPPRRATGNKAYFALEKKDYPHFYAIADVCAKNVGYTGRYYLMLGDGDISVSEEDRVAYVNLSPELAPLLTEEELSAVLTHEFAHVVHDDTALAEKFRIAVFRYKERERFGKFSRLFFSYFGEIIDTQTDLFLSYSSIISEQNADEEVKQHADAQAFMDATAKTYLFDELYREPIVEFAYGIYAGEAAPDDFYKQRAEYYRAHAEEFYPKALPVMMRRLPALNDTHPTFAMRAQTFGIDEFHPFHYPEGEFLSEALKYTAACDSELHHYLTMQWKEMREQNYEDLKTIFERYESAPERATEATKLMALDAYYRVDAEKALALADLLLQEDANCNMATIIKGMALCRRDDESGLPLLLEGIRNDINSTNAFGLYGECVLRTGKQELLDELRKIQAPFGQEIVDAWKKRYREGLKFKPSHLIAYTRNERFEKIKTSVQDLVQITLKDLWLCEKRNENGITKTFLMVPFPTDERQEKIIDRLQLYFTLLWRKGEEFYVWQCKPNDKFYRRARAVGTQIA